MDGSCCELDLASVVCVKVCPPREDVSMFHFEVHFSGSRGSPWLLRAYTQVYIHTYDNNIVTLYE